MSAMQEASAEGSRTQDASIEGFKDGASYDKFRPSYPDEAVDSLLKHLEVGGLKRARIIDLAAGTGKFTELLSQCPEGYEIVAVEPQDAMREALDKKGLRNVIVLKGEASSMPVESQRFDAVIVASAFHWFANDRTLDEIYRVLIPGGVLGMIWIVADYSAPGDHKPTTQWEGKSKAICRSFWNPSVRKVHEAWQDVFQKQLDSTPLTIQTANPRFSLPLEIEHFPFTHWLSRDALWDRFRTSSYISVLEGETLASTKQKVYEVMDEPDVEWNERGELAVHGQTSSARTTAIPGAPLQNGG